MDILIRMDWPLLCQTPSLLYVVFLTAGRDSQYRRNAQFPTKWGGAPNAGPENGLKGFARDVAENVE